MIAEVIDKGDATFTVKYNAENGAEAMIMGMMATAEKEKNITLHMGSERVLIGGYTLPVIAILLKKWGAA